MRRMTQDVHLELGSLIDTIATVKADVSGFKVQLIEVLVHSTAFSIPGDNYIDVLSRLKLDARMRIMELFRDASGVRDHVEDYGPEGA